MTIIVSPAAPTIHSVSVFICFVSGVSSIAVAESMCAIFPTCVSPPVPVTIMHAAAVRDRRVHERHVRLVAGAELAVGQRRRVLRRGNALAGQRGLVDLERARGDDPPVRGHLVAGRDQHDVADDELLGRDLRLGAVATHPRGRLHHRLERVHRALGLALLAQPDDRVEQRDHEQDDRRCSIP